MGWSDLIGMRLDQYDIVAELGRGGSSRVYHAIDTTSGQDVAIKVIPNDADDRAMFTNRFQREVTAVQKLHHPNIVAVFGAGENDEFVYLVMQCVTGGTLRKQLTGSLPVPDAAAYMVQIAYALQHAHERGVIHRDVKPSNMLLEYPGSNHVLLTDFGIAKIQGAMGLTKSGTTIGTPEYMSPEQAEGRDIDERSDIYALGCVLYETLAGRPPFLGSTPVSVLFQHVHSRPAYIRGFNPGVPAELVHILEIALAKRPDERYGSADSFARALLPFAGELPKVVVQQPETGPIVISRSRGLTPSRPLPHDQRLKESDLPDRDTIHQHPPGVRPGIYEETTEPLPSISGRKTLPPAPHLHRHGSQAGFPRKTVPPRGARNTAPPSRSRKTMPPLTPVRRSPPLSERNPPSGVTDKSPMEREAAAGVGPLTPPQPMTIHDQSREPISLTLGASTRRSPVSGPIGSSIGANPDQLERAPNSRPGGRRPTRPLDTPIPIMWPRPRKTGRRVATIVAAVIVLVLFGWFALNASGLGIAFGGKPQATTTHQQAAPTATLAPSATATPTTTPGPQPTATLTQQQILNQQAHASFRAVTLATFADGSCSGSNGQSSFSYGQAFYINLCTSGRTASGSMTITVRQNGQVVYTMAYNINISPSASYWYYTAHVFSSGTYDVLVTLNINGTTAVARDLTLHIR